MKKLLILFFISITKIVSANECSFYSNPKIIFQGPHELHQVWTEEVRDIFWSTQMPDSASLVQYLNTVKAKIADLNPYVLLQKEYMKFMSTGDPELMLEAQNMFLVLNKQIGTIRSVKCLENLLLSKQTDRGFSWDTPMEFSSFILQKNEGKKVFIKIYFSTNDRPGGKINDFVIQAINSDIAKDWIFLNHLHNHNFNLPVKENIVLVGAPSPGLSDAGLYRDLYKEMGLRSASVTNGFDTIDIQSSEFNLFIVR
jgi:hypothetical protein